MSSEITLQIECRNCGKVVPVPVDKQGYENWKVKKISVQRALPNTPKELREMLISRTCPKCWSRAFGEESE